MLVSRGCMKIENTKQKIIDTALDLFSKNGYDSVGVGEIAEAVGIKAPSLYNHFKSKQEIFNAIVEYVAKRYENDTDKINIHVQDVKKDVHVFEDISEKALSDKVKQIFCYSLHDQTICRFRKMLTIEQFRSTELANLYTERYITRMVDYHAEIFRNLIGFGIIKDENPDTLALLYVAPIITLLGVCDRHPERENECLEKLDAHVRLFFNTFNIVEGKSK